MKAGSGSMANLEPPTDESMGGLLVKTRRARPPARRPLPSQRQSMRREVSVNSRSAVSSAPVGESFNGAQQPAEIICLTAKILFVCVGR